MNKTLDPKRHSWVDTAGTDFPVQNLPYGIFVPLDHGNDPKAARVGVAIGNQILDLAACHRAGLLHVPGVVPEVLCSSSLNAFIALGAGVHSLVRERVFDLLVEGGADDLSKTCKDVPELLIPASSAKMMLPTAVGDFVDFYSSLEHASNVGSMFRDPENPLLPNWKHIPIGYHGRSSSLYVSGTPVFRPAGQLKNDDGPPVFAPSRQLDFELEMGFIVGANTKPGERIAAPQAFSAMFGMVVVNDWSARDIQKWEYVPLGPFLGKSFATTVSPWVVPMVVIDALRTAEPVRDVPILPYLEDGGRAALDIDLEVELETGGSGSSQRISRTNFKHMYWTVCQQLAHMTSNGTPVRIGDLYASGTVSGKTPDSYGSMLELCWKGTRPLKLADGTQRNFLQDGDRVIMKAHGTLPGGVKIGFGSCEATVLPLPELQNSVVAFDKSDCHSKLRIK